MKVSHFLREKPHRGRQKKQTLTKIQCNQPANTGAVALPSHTHGLTA